MKIVLSGVETNNKGAELMLYAILQEIERKFPEAKVYIPPFRIKQGLGYVKTRLDFRYTSSPLLCKLICKFHVGGIFRMLHISPNILAQLDIVKGAEWFIDGSGFAFGDQWQLSDTRINLWRYRLKPLKDNGCKLVFLPQALGPAKKPETKKAFAMLSEYASIIMPREQVSYNYVKESGMVDMSKVRMFTDFTSLVEGTFPKDYIHLKDGICVIPNIQMINKQKISYEDYITLLTAIIEKARKSGHPVYLLNHGGVKDEELCYRCKESLGGNIDVVTGINALEVKGLIASAYAVITSRFHGLASALNSSVPSLATSWSHKYEELFRNYGITDSVLPLDNLEKALEKVDSLLAPPNNAEIRAQLNGSVPQIKAQTCEMWKVVWNLNDATKRYY